MPKLRALDGLRACAAGSVVAYHVCIAFGLTHGNALAGLAAGLKGGVTLFFILSGYLLYLPYARSRQGGGPRPEWRTYAQRRALRILPGYWAALTLLGLGPLSGHVFTSDWWRFYGLTQVYDPGTLLGGLGVAWSLGVEISFYAVLPLLARGIEVVSARWPRADLAILGALALASIVLRTIVCGSVLGPVHSSFLTLATALPGALDWFAIGMALASASARWEREPEWAPRMARLAACAPGCWLLAAVAYTAGAVAQRGDLFLGLLGTTSHVALGVTGGLLLLAATAPGRAPRRSWRLDSRAVAWLGTISYGVYLWHVPLLDVVHPPGGAFPPPVSVGAGLGVVAAVAAGSVALGAVSWYAIERPAQRLGARLTRPGPVALVSPDPVLPRLRPEPSFAGGSRNS